MATQISDNTGSGNGFLADGTKPITEPMLIKTIEGQWQSEEGGFMRHLSYQLLNSARILLIGNVTEIFQGPMS